MKNYIKELLKTDTVLCVATLLATLSMLIIKPDQMYIGYIDFRTLAILFSLMAVMEGMKSIGLFEWIARQLLKKVHTILQLILTLTGLCFFFSMLITNDVALITFVPLTIIILKFMGTDMLKKWLVPVVVMQTIAANLGSMLTPVGNPQNLYLCGQTHLTFFEFVWMMFPYALFALCIICLWCIWISRSHNGEIYIALQAQSTIHQYKKLVIYVLLFALCLLTVSHIISYQITFVVILIVMSIIDFKAIKQVDYGLLVTFIAFFIFIGNMGRIDSAQVFLKNILQGHEIITSVILSQVISNVPAALLLSGFTDQVKELIIGTNLGGLGTLIASMASLISFKYVMKAEQEMVAQYLKYFTVSNIVFLCLMGGFTWLML